MKLPWVTRVKPTGSDPGDKMFAAAMKAASDVSIQTHSVMDQIRPYTESEDPFGAIFAARDTAESFEDDQEGRIFLGPKE